MKNTWITLIQMVSPALGMLAYADDPVVQAKKARGFYPRGRAHLEPEGQRVCDINDAPILVSEIGLL
jgi:hypothetical protein